MLMRKGYWDLVVQIGNGSCEPKGPAVESFHLDWYRFKPSLKPDMSTASLIISHGGMYPDSADMKAWHSVPMNTVYPSKLRVCRRGNSCKVLKAVRRQRVEFLYQDVQWYLFSRGG